MNSSVIGWDKSGYTLAGGKVYSIAGFFKLVLFVLLLPWLLYTILT